MDSIDYPPPPSQPLCYNVRTRNLEGRFRKTELGDESYFIIDSSCYPSDAREDEKSSHHHHQLLLRCNNEESKQNDFRCDACLQYIIGCLQYIIYYLCIGCCRYSCFHKECVESPAIFISPYYPKYPLQLLQMVSTSITARVPKTKKCHSCGIRLGRLIYYSSIYDLILDPICAQKREFSVINNRKRHEHTLHYFPRKVSLNCDICGSDDNKICFYICHQCSFVVHRTCVNLPNVIQISRHNHRLFLNSSLSSEKWSCGVCRQKIDRNYWEYSCSKGCAYAVHCKCAMQDDVWDGKELEDQPEEVYDNIKSYEEIGDGLIRHFCHPHHNMRFNEDIGKMYYEKKQCEACLLAIYHGNSYRCMQCDFNLHEECANLPRRIQNMVHAHQFILQRPYQRPDSIYKGFFCESCHRYSCGFRYNCCEGWCNKSLDVRCASLYEPVHHQSHPHPLFLLYTRTTKEPCLICGEVSYLLLNCVKCFFALCFRCATLPYKVKHEGDEHFLTLSYENVAIYPHWCEVCEEKMDPKKGYYTCSECGTTIHIQCILGNDPYMKPGLIFTFSGLRIYIIPNNRLIRPVCSHCQRRCQYKLVFTSGGDIFCSYSEILDGPEKRCITRN